MIGRSRSHGEHGGRDDNQLQYKTKTYDRCTRGTLGYPDCLRA